MEGSHERWDEAQSGSTLDPGASHSSEMTTGGHQVR